MQFEVKPASIKEKPIIQSLIQPYLDELSRFPDEHLGYKDENDNYIYPYINFYWEEDVRFPYLLYSNDEIAGFALINKNDDLWEISEFYVKPEYRRQGIAEACTADIFRKHPGNWRISFNKYNIAGMKLWLKTAENLATGDIERGEADITHDYILFTL